MAKIEIGKNDFMVDEPLNIRVYTSEPGQQITIRMEMTDDEGKTFLSQADFISDESSVIDLNTAVPMNGSYNQADGSGLLWSMTGKKGGQDDYFVKKSDEDLEAGIYVMTEDEILATAVLTLQFKNDLTEMIEIEDPDIKGRLYAPAEDGNYPSVMILGGSDGGNEAHAASFLAGKGYLVLALSYFNDDGLGEHLEKVDMEYFKKASDFLAGHAKSNGKVNLIGYSKGGELALLLGRTFNAYQSIVAGAASNYVTSGMKGGIFAPVPGWMLDGEPLPYLKMKFPVSFMISTITNYIRKRPMYFLDIWKRSLSRKKSSEYKIEVGEISAPLMMISGGEDKLWPSAVFSEEMMKERENEGDVFLTYENAGHFIAFPYSFHQLPSIVHMNLDGMVIDFGGTKQDNAEAAKNTLTEILSFLKKNNSGKSDFSK
ncbi:acyl-CoA thioesterase/bile acid-CoA:amino acid N-acyltransferase family protein [Lacicoccus alkaliphilus]|uniref:Dienelactone hydrolase n=1 Tax=Lacicoccus alkaliphilus DSM 16010 TaxID=1123231 RepID=A0A1M7DRN2_9BACL|nr:acyl-CoA thioesterase/bile acid-CoA:amino acid N-acyltransferase family protein [Salinicoccus alkaliphilus]SHL82140.1 Dienelactone hydrolase [Salinicoccus alkaliphilus DSM 16010]